jgi:hypothetical protein
MKSKSLRIASLLGCLAFAVSVVPGEASAAAWFNCQAQSVFEHDNTGTPLLMVSCANEYQTGVNWTAIQISSTTSQQQNRFTSMAQAAILSGRPFRVFMTDTTCPKNANCRIASSWALYF